MHRLILTIVAIATLVACTSKPAKADLITTTGSGMGLQLHIGKLDFLIPFNEGYVTYLYDFIGKRSLVGGETPIIKLWDIAGTVGGVTSPEGQGAPFVGGKLQLPNPVPTWAFLGDIQPGLYGGYDWRAGPKGAAIAGFKFDKKIY